MLHRVLRLHKANCSASGPLIITQHAASTVRLSVAAFCCAALVLFNHLRRLASWAPVGSGLAANHFFFNPRTDAVGPPRNDRCGSFRQRSGHYNQRSLLNPSHSIIK